MFTQATPAPVLSTANQPLRAKVLFDYQATGPQSMSLVKGQIIEVRTRGDPGGWSIGLTGAFPTDFVEFLPAASAPSATSASAKSDPFSGLDLNPTPITSTIQSNKPTPVAAQPSATQSTSASQTQPTAVAKPVSNVPDTTASAKPASNFIPPPPPKKVAATPAASANPGSSAPTATAPPQNANIAQAAIPSTTSQPPPSQNQNSTSTPAHAASSVGITPMPSAVVSQSAPVQSLPNPKSADPQGFQRIEKQRRSSTVDDRSALKPLDGSSFVLIPGNLSSENAVWRQYLFMDLFADCHVRQMADPASQIRSSSAISRVMIALNTIQKGLQYIDLSTYPTAVEVDSVRDVHETLLNTVKVTLDLCSRIPVRTNEPGKMFTFLATLIMRITKLAIGDYVMFPLSWQNTTNYKSETDLAEHAILIIIRRINRDPSSDFSVTIVNTSVDEGLCYHVRNRDIATIINQISFVGDERK